MNPCSICRSEGVCEHREIGLLTGRNRKGVMYSIAAESTGFHRRNSQRSPIQSIKRKAHELVRIALKEGWLKRATECENCGGINNIQGHHEDYTEPLEVIWLCKECHWVADALRIKQPKVPVETEEKMTRLLFLKRNSHFLGC